MGFRPPYSLLAAAALLSACTAGGNAPGEKRSRFAAHVEARQQIICRGPVSDSVTITRGGAYRVNVRSEGTGVTVDTAEPVTLSGCIASSGRQIDVVARSADVTVDRLRGRWTLGAGSKPRSGRFLRAIDVNRIQVFNSEIIDSEGIRIDGGKGTKVNIFGNYVEDIRQIVRRSPFAQFVQLANMKDVDAEIAYNVVRNTPGKASPEDIISIYKSNGPSRDNPIWIHHNDIEGAFPIDPGRGGYSGGGIMGGDGSPEGNAVRNVLIEYNRIARTTNYGIAFAAGRGDNLIARNNCVIHAQTDVLPANNVGLYAANLHGDKKFGRPRFRDNEVYWFDGKGNSNNWWLPDGENLGNLSTSNCKPLVSDASH